jgi:hypothetical protein
MLLEWQWTPISYYISNEMLPYQDAIDGAASLWNNETCPVLARTYNRTFEDVYVMYGGSYDNILASTSHSSHNGRYATSALVKFARLSDLHTMYHWSAHEFGHVLGLGHDHYSIMRPKLPMAIKGIKRALPSDADIGLLKQLYCGE